MEAKFAFSSVTRLSGTSILSVSLIIKSFHGFLFSSEHAENLEWNDLILNVSAQSLIESECLSLLWKIAFIKESIKIRILHIK